MSQVPVRRYLAFDGILHGIRSGAFYGSEITWCKRLDHDMRAVWSIDPVTCLKCLAVGDTDEGGLDG